MEIREKMARKICEINNTNPDEFYSLSGKDIYYWEDFLPEVDAALQVLADIDEYAVQKMQPSLDILEADDMAIDFRQIIQSIQQGE